MVLRESSQSRFSRTLFVAIAAVLSIVAVSGCWRPSPKPTPPVRPAPPVAPPAPVPSVEPEASPPSDAAATEPDKIAETSTAPGVAAPTETGEGEAPSETAASGETTAETPEAVEDPEAIARAEAVREATQRLLVATPGGPTIVDAQLFADGEPPARALDEVIAEILTLADANADGSPTWDEVFERPIFKLGVLGNDAIPGESEARRARELYDTNRDGVVQGGEVPRFVTRNAGASRSFTLQTANFFRYYQKNESAVRLIVDADRDGRLTQEELAAGPTALAAFDADDDEILSGEEIEVDARDSFRRQRPLNSRTDPETALLVDDRLAPDALRRWLSESYAFSGGLEAGIFPDRPDLETALDADGDGEFSQEELEAFRTLPPDVVVRVDFGVATEGAPSGALAVGPYGLMGSGGTRVEVVDTRLGRLPASDEGSLSAVRADAGVPSRAVIDAGGTMLRIAANDGAPSSEQSSNIFRQADANADGKIDEAERGMSPILAQVAVEAVDLDGDGAYSVDETSAYFRRATGVQRAKVRGLAMEDRDALFVTMDRNLDGRLQPGEWQDLAASLKAYDADGDGALTVGELPSVTSLIFIRGDLQQSEDLFRRPPERVVGQGEAPRWLAMMDRNEDGVVTRREFPGPPEKFDELDGNRDGAVDAAEALAVTPETSSEPAAEESEVVEPASVEEANPEAGE